MFHKGDKVFHIREEILVTILDKFNTNNNFYIVSVGEGFDSFPTLKRNLTSIEDGIRRLEYKLSKTTKTLDNLYVEQRRLESAARA